MIEGGWSYIYASYALTVALLGGLALVVALRALYWARQARKLETKP
jgi:hypothetical protein